MESKKRMSMVVALVVLLGLVGSSAGAVFKVGDSAGWTTMGNVNYGLWASAKTFKVGDAVGEFSNFSVKFLCMHKFEG
jgi:predicted benzoate:H+ symporter BenE